MSNLQHYQDQLGQDRYGFGLAARLSVAADALPYDITERLRAARVRALGQRKVAVVRTATSMAVSGGAASLTLGGEYLSPWGRVAALVPLLVLVVGLITIDAIDKDDRAQEIAEIDAALLTDDLPPTAYADPGFLQFLRTNAPQD